VYRRYCREAGKRRRRLIGSERSTVTIGTTEHAAELILPAVTAALPEPAGRLRQSSEPRRSRPPSTPMRARLVAGRATTSPSTP